MLCYKYWRAYLRVIFFRRVCPSRVWPVSADSRGNWRPPKTAQIPPRVTWPWSAPNTALSSPPAPFPDPRCTWCKSPEQPRCNRIKHKKKSNRVRAKIKQSVVSSSNIIYHTEKENFSSHYSNYNHINNALILVIWFSKYFIIKCNLIQHNIIY